MTDTIVDHCYSCPFLLETTCVKGFHEIADPYKVPDNCPLKKGPVNVYLRETFENLDKEN